MNQHPYDGGTFEPTEDELRSAPVVPGFELPDSVTLHRAIVAADGLQPEDIGVLAWLKLRDPRLPATKEDLAREMQAAGWKMGKTRFDAIFQRLKTVGHIKHRSAYNPATGRPEWVIEFFLNPANNDQYVNSGISTFPQVRAETLETGDSEHEHSFETPETSVSRGQKESQVSRDSGAKPRKPAFPSGHVSAGQSRNSENRVFGSPPPHPPEEEVGTTSPSPHKHATASRRGKQETPDVSPEAAAAARDFLLKLPGPWAAGMQRAQSLAPWLAYNAEQTGWPLDISLRMYLTRQETGKGQIKNYGAMLAYRVKEMQSREAVMQAAAETEVEKEQQGAQQGSESSSRLPKWCGKCNGGEEPLSVAMRTVPAPDIDDDRVFRCKQCHPAEVRARA